VSQIIQIAGVRSIDEARMLAAAGATHIGLPLRLAVHAPDVGEAGAAAIVRGLPASVTCVLITYLTDPAEAAALARTLGVGAVQLHGEMPPAAVRELRALAPGLALFKSLIVAPGNQAELLSLAAAFEPHVDAFLTDTLDPLSGAGGATGKTHDWAVSRRIVEAVRRPVILAGGLTPDNVREAIAIVRPSGVDAHTGLEDARGDKDPALVRRFVAEARAGFAALGR
jgi:phosphoribosylanthranilate isomerase